MLNNSNHKAMLYILELLLNSETKITLSQLFVTLANKNTGPPDIMQIIGDSEDNLKIFLQHFPSLFIIDGAFVAPVAFKQLTFSPLITQTTPFVSVNNHDTIPINPAYYHNSSQSEYSTSNNKGFRPRANCAYSNINANSNRTSNNQQCPNGTINVQQNYTATSYSKSNSFNNSDFRNASFVRSNASQSYSRDLQTSNQYVTHNLSRVSYDESSYGVIFRRPPNNSNFNLETEAVKFFKTQLLKQVERWIPIKSLAGHLSQTSSEIRRIVGPQLEFRHFLLKHPHVFNVQGDLVTLKDNFPSVCLSSNRPKSHYHERTERQPVRPVSLCLDNEASSLRASESSEKISAIELPEMPTIESTPITPSTSLLLSCKSENPGLQITLSLSDYKAIMFFRKLIMRKGSGAMTMSELMRYYPTAPESVRNSIGWTRIELEEFLRKQSILFKFEESGERVLAQKVHKLNIVITGASHNVLNGTSPHTLINQKGQIFHVAKLWGIIDLGRHEHVFFDKSLLRNVDDLQKHFQIGNYLYFNAILAPKESRAKWRATQIWMESDRKIVEHFSGSSSTAIMPSHSKHDQRKKLNSIIKAHDIFNNRDDMENIMDGLQLADDIKFLSDELEEELANAIDRRDYEKNGDGLSIDDALITTNGDSDDDKFFLEMDDDISDNDSWSNASLVSQCSHDINASPTESEQVYPSVDVSILNSYNDKNLSTSECLPELNMAINKVSCSTQTIFTGDIMVAQIYLDTT